MPVLVFVGSTLGRVFLIWSDNLAPPHHGHTTRVSHDPGFLCLFPGAAL
jgi:hypothetical protein